MSTTLYPDLWRVETLMRWIKVCCLEKRGRFYTWVISARQIRLKAQCSQCFSLAGFYFADATK